MVDLEQADGQRHLNLGSGRGDAGDPFPGSTNNINFDIDTNPNSNDYNTQNTFVSIRNIRKNGTDMVADFDIGSQPYLVVNNVSISENVNHNGRVEPGETADVNFNISNISPANSSNSLFSYSIDVNGINVENNQSISGFAGGFSGNISIESAFTIDPDFIPSTVTLHYSIKSEGNSISDSVYIVVGIPDILIVSKAINDTLGEYYFSSLKDLSKNYEVSFNQAPEFLDQRNVLIVYSGSSNTNLFTPDEINLFEDFLSNGGNIFFNGQALAENLQNDYPSFLNNTIGVSYVLNQLLPQFVYGLQGDLFGDLFGNLKIRGSDGASNETFPDVLAKTDSMFNFSLSYTNNGSKPAGGWIDKSNGAKIIFWGFGFESINNNESSISRTEVMNTILQYFDGALDVEGDNSLTVTDYNLYQNYPNPFNPVTKITFQMPEKDFVTLKVYDIIGREIQTLVNEEKPAGKYEISFDASEFSSGVYFYKISSGSYSDIKKMILIK